MPKAATAAPCYRISPLCLGWNSKNAPRAPDFLGRCLFVCSFQPLQPLLKMISRAGLSVARQVRPQLRTKPGSYACCVSFSTCSIIIFSCGTRAKGWQTQSWLTWCCNCSQKARRINHWICGRWKYQGGGRRGCESQRNRENNCSGQCCLRQGELKSSEIYCMYPDC
jgi:hypothetical protein